MATRPFTSGVTIYTDPAELFPEYRIYRYSATVNGTRRTIMFSGPVELTFDDACLMVDNTEALYVKFYADATAADYDADHEEATVEVFAWSEVES